MDRTTRWRTQLAVLENKYARLISKESLVQDFAFWDCYFYGSQCRTESEKNKCDQLHALEADMRKFRQLLGEPFPGPVIGIVNAAVESVDSLGTKMRPGDIIHAVRQAGVKLEEFLRDQPTQI